MMAKQRSYTGGSGQMLVVAELLFRQCNAAIPQVDYGTDVFAFHDDRDDVARVQVKTTQGNRYKAQEGYSAKFGIPMRQLRRSDSPPLYYALVTRLGGKWEDAVIISRKALADLWNGGQRFGTENPRSGDLELTVQFRAASVVCSEVDLTEYRNAWHTLPPLQSPAEL